MKYYNGIIYNKDCLKDLIINIEYARNKVIDMSMENYKLIDEEDNRFEYLNDDEKELLDAYFRNYIENKKNDININNILLKMYKDKLLIIGGNSSIPIIYEKIIDEEGNLYAKELITGIIFPISKDFDIESKLKKESKVEKKECYVNEDRDNRKVINIESIDRDASAYFYGKKDSIYHVIPVGNLIGDDEYKIEQIPDGKRQFEVVKLGTYVKSHMIYLTLSIKPIILFSNLDLGKIFVNEKSIANTKEIEKYKNKYQNKFGNRHQYKRFINELKSLANENVYKGEIIPKKEEKIELLKKDDITIKMENIEYMLLKLKNYNQDSYEKYSLEYQNLLSSDKLKISLNIQSLTSLEAKIEACFKYGINTGIALITYLDNIKNIYVNSLMYNNIESNYTINEIDKIMELYLKMQNDFDPVNKRKITSSIALLYLFELIENKDNLDNIDITNSYIKDNIKPILIWLNYLIEEEIIKTSKLIDLNTNYNLDDIIDIIKGIEFKDINEDKIKKL